MNQVLYRGKVWYAIDTLEGVKLSRGHDIEILTQDEYDYALMRGDVKMLEKKEKIKVIEIKEEVTIGDIILEKGDRIEVLKESKLSDGVSDAEFFINDIENFLNDELEFAIETIEGVMSDQPKFFDALFDDSDKNYITAMITKSKELSAKLNK